MAPPPPTPALPEDLIEGILLRFPPDEPACLFRASLVCKPWCRLISGPGFRRRYRKFHHRSPPLLGFFSAIFATGGISISRFVPSATFGSPQADLRHCCAIDAHHGRVLLLCPGNASSENVLVVWDPISDERRELRMPTRLSHRCRWDWNAAVLCAAAGGPCGHLDCHRGPFVVVFVDTHALCNLSISTYSSDTGTWSDRIFPHQPLHSISILLAPCAHVGNALYFRIETPGTALKYDLCLREMSAIQLPPTSTQWQPLALTSTEDGGLGCATVHGFKLYMWSRKDGSQVDAGWTQDRVIDIELLLKSNAILTSPSVVGFANGIDVVFLRATDVILTIDLKTKTLKKLSKGTILCNILPYMSFYTPALGAACRGE